MQIDVEQCTSLLHNTTSHFYLRPHIKLRSVIAHYTYMDETVMENNMLLTLVPDVAGCIVLSDTKKELHCTYWGPTTYCVQVRAEKDDIKFRFFIEFLPSGAYSLLHIPQGQLLNQKFKLDAFNPTLHKELCIAYEESLVLSEFIKKVDSIMMKFFLLDTFCTKHLQQKIAQPFVNMDEIINDIGYSKRHIQRMFNEQIGCTMKDYQRIERINQAVRYMQNTSFSGSEIAMNCGYYDQSHFIRDFKIVCGVTPKEYKKRMSDFYNESLKF